MTSTAYTADDAVNFLGQWYGGNPRPGQDLIMEIHVPKGTPILGGGLQGAELMLKPGTKFRVISKGKMKGFDKVVVEVVP